MTVEISEREIAGVRKVIRNYDPQRDKQLIEVAQTAAKALNTHSFLTERFNMSIEKWFNAILERLQHKRSFTFKIHRDKKGFIESIDVLEK